MEVEHGDFGRAALRSVDSSDRGLTTVRTAAASADNRWLAFGLKGPVVAVRSFDDAEKKDVDLDKGQFPRSVAFDSAVTTLAVGVGYVPPDNLFYMETDDHVRLFDVAKGDSKAKKPLDHTGRAESLAFHPDGGLLAVAGGNDHEVSLHDLTKNGQIVSVMHGVGTCLWDVGLPMADGNVLGFKDHRNSPEQGAERARPGRVADVPAAAPPLGVGRRLQTGRTARHGGRLDGEAGRPGCPRLVRCQRGGTAYRLEDTTSARDGMPRCCTLHGSAMRTIRRAWRWAITGA